VTGFSSKLRALMSLTAAFASILMSATRAHAQYTVRAGAATGGTVGEWGRVAGFLFGVDQMTPSRSFGWWSTHFNVERLSTRFERTEKLAGLRLIRTYTSPPETTAFKNSFSVTAITLGARYEPCRRWLGFRQTSKHLLSPFVGWYGGYMRMEHTGSREYHVAWTSVSSHGVPVGAVAGYFMGWGGPPENALDPGVSSTYTGLEIGLDVSSTAWISGHTFVAPRAGLPDGLKTPYAPRVLLRVSIAHRTAPVRRDG